MGLVAAKIDSKHFDGISRGSQNKHTIGFAAVYADDKRKLASEEVMANARLIAAAPDLIEACEAAVAALKMFASSTCCDGDDDGVSHENKCKVGQALVALGVAIAKAGGE